MRSALMTNSSTAAAIATQAPTPPVTGSAAQAVSSVRASTEKLQEGAVLAKERAPSRPKKTDGTFEDEVIDKNKDGVVPESIDEKRYHQTKKLLTVA